MVSQWGIEIQVLYEQMERGEKKERKSAKSEAVDSASLWMHKIVQVSNSSVLEGESKINYITFLEIALSFPAGTLVSSLPHVH